MIGQIRRDYGAAADAYDESAIAALSGSALTLAALMGYGK